MRKSLLAAALFAIVFSLLIGGMAHATTHHTTTTTVPGDGDIACANTQTGAPVSLISACAGAPVADADALCSALARGGDAAAICGNLNVNDMDQVCRPYIDANAVAICRPKVDASVSVYCGAHITNRVNAQNKTICGDAIANCSPNAFTFALIKNSCDQAQKQAQEQTTTCSQTNANSFNATQSCEQAALTCDSSNTNINNCPAPQAVCARWKHTRAFINGKDPVSGKHVKSVIESTRCTKWAKPTFTYVNP